MLVVRVPNADPGPPFQGVPRVEAAAEDPVGRGEEADWEVEGSVEGTGPPSRWEVQPGGAGLPRDHGYGRAGDGGGGRRRQRGVSAGGAGVDGRAGSGAEEPDWEGHHCSFPRPTSWRPQESLRRGAVLGVLSFVLSFALHARTSFFCNLLGANHIFRGQAWADGKGVLETSRHCADS